MFKCIVSSFFLVFLLFQSNSLFACCSSPLAEIVYIGTISEIESETIDGAIKQKITIKKSKNIVSNAPEKFVLYANSESLVGYHKVIAKKGVEYIVTLYDAGKHDDKYWLLKKEGWKEQQYHIHPYTGFFRENSSEAKLLLKFISFHKDLVWTNDFKLINIFFLME